jgi:hypothetical protein
MEGENPDARTLIGPVPHVRNGTIESNSRPIAAELGYYHHRLWLYGSRSHDKLSKVPSH